MAAHSPVLARVSPAVSRLQRLLTRPRVLGVACVALLAALGWIYLGVMAGSTLSAGQGAPGFPGLWPGGRLDDLARALVTALCQPTLGTAGPHFGMPSAGAWGALDFALVLLMWAAMVLAMMLPTAGNMVLSYADIAEAAAAKGERVVSPLVLTAGYLAVWLGFAVAATALQWGLRRLAILDPAMASASGLFSGTVLIAAGTYQFSALKHACLTLCQRPFPFFLAHWSNEARAVFRLGLRQGAYCVGCCWAMMLVMVAVGVMNIVWMAGLGAVMAIEKMATTRFSRAVGVLLIGGGVVFVVTAVAAHWPAAGN